VIVRCGRCRSEFEVLSEGRVSCPVCGTPNEVRRPEDQGLATPPPPPEPGQPSPRASCPGCGFSFIVGDVETALCPNCGAEVEIGTGES
jgi:rRNA maturation endonuclease Nob1